MKKLIFIGLAVILALALVTCGFTPNAIEGGEDGYTNVVYSKDGQSLTLYLDGGVPITDADRALNKDMAISGHNFFEAVFLANDGSDDVVARVSWSRGETAAVRGIYRSGTGITYNAVDPASATGTAGAAILFVGRRSDKTLLAIGRLSAVDAGLATAPITSTTKSVTFTIAALKAGALPDVSQVADPLSSFLTDNGDPGNIDAASTTMNGQTLSSSVFPIYIINPIAPLNTVGGTYTILTTEAALGTPDLSMTSTGILDSIIANGNPTAETIFPQFFENGVLKEVADVSLAKGVTITPTAGTTVNVVNLTFNVSAARTNLEAGVNSFYFEIPVVALIDAPSSADGNVIPVEWVMRPGFGTNLINLDDGKYGFGGATLIGILANEFTPVVINKTGP